MYSNDSDTDSWVSTDDEEKYTTPNDPFIGSSQTPHWKTNEKIVHIPRENEPRRKQRRRKACFVWEGTNWTQIYELFRSCFPWISNRNAIQRYDKLS